MIPKVSVCIPTYNYAHYICNAILSVHLQSFADFELVIIDDCSTDYTSDIVFNWIKADPRIRYIRNDKRLGFVRNFTKCIEVAKGKYVKILCADDTLEANCLNKMVHVLDTYKQVSLVACSRSMVDEQLNFMQILSYSTGLKLVPGTEVIKKCIFSGNVIGEPTAVIFRKKDALRGFNSNYHLLVDLEMWFHLLEKGDFYFIPEPLCKFRQHKNQATYDCVKTLSFIEDNDRLYQEYIRKPYIRNSIFNAIRKRFGMAFIIWAQRDIIRNSQLLKDRISRYMNYYLALILMPAYSTYKTWLIKNNSTS